MNDDARSATKTSLEPMRQGQDPGQLKDGTPTYKDYAECRSNRFLTPEQAGKNRLNSPSTHVYIFNMPTDVTEEQLNKVPSYDFVSN